MIAVVFDVIAASTFFGSKLNFGFVDEVTVVAPGINGKLSEINAAFGLLQLKHIDSAMSLRKEIGQRYSSGLKSVEGISLSHISAGLESNYSYYPILVEDDYPLSRDDIHPFLMKSTSS